jgi:hypothetical protein
MRQKPRRDALWQQRRTDVLLECPRTLDHPRRRDRRDLLTHRREQASGISARPHVQRDAIRILQLRIVDVWRRRLGDRDILAVAGNTHDLEPRTGLTADADPLADRVGVAQNFFANAWLTTTTSGAPGRSASVKPRPRTSGTSIVSK